MTFKIIATKYRGHEYTSVVYITIKQFLLN